MIRAALLLAALLLLPGCTISTEWRGDGAFLLDIRENPPAWKTGETTIVEVVSVLGPPDEIVRRGRELILVYRYRFLKARELRIVAYGGQFFRWFDGKEVDSLVVIAFDPDDHLAYLGRGKYAGDKGVGSILLD